MSDPIPDNVPPGRQPPPPGKPRVERRARLPRLFLWVVAITIFIVIAAGLTWRLAGNRLLSAALVPGGAFDAAAAGAPYDYARPQAWAARPGMADDPTAWRPTGAPAPAKGDAAVFFVPPTAAFGRAQWNDRTDAGDTGSRLAGFLRTEASALADAGPLWAPHYRQAVIGSFLADAPDTRRSADAALALAYGDVAAAFAAFVAAQPADAPIILAGHSQGALHLLRLLKEQVAGTLLQARIAAVYMVGWPVSVTADLPALGLPACTMRGQPGCILSWQSFAEPADPEAVLAVYQAGTGLTGAPRRDTAMLCTNPLTGGAAPSAPASANPGSLVPSASLAAGELVTPGVPARCDARGILLIGEAPTGYPAFVLPGNNFHVFDYPLFWAAVRQDAAARVLAWKAAAEAGR
ncbi:DUF3089 domain-containing protein [Sandarakinorhabdus sp.]|uniref:DUF3089 domain-containing protein n=1 Tax=Sandarakinorhabdus sp. TaxID=1916663 RepID=UPI003F702D1E